jgi:diketogulonate reductase-like aldo/keto reductase
LEAGYRHIDTAMGYSNESDVGQSVRASGVPREDIFVTSKITTSALSYDGTVAALDESMGKLDIGYVDLYLIHWPVNDWQGAWRALEAANQDGRVRAIGVSNFMQHHLEELFDVATIRPTVNQFEYHPYLQQPDLVTFCKYNDIAVTSWAPIMKGRVVDVPELIKIGEQYGKSAVQVTLRWMLQTNIITIPKSARQERIQSNTDIYDFELSAADIATINGLDKDERIGPHPDTVGR